MTYNALDKTLHFAADSGHAAVIFHQDGSINSKKYGPNLGFTGNLSGSGYQKLPSGLIIQWGNAVNKQSYNTAWINFPIAFPVRCFNVITGTSMKGVIHTVDSDFSKTKFYVRFSYGANHSIGNITYIAIGH